MGAMSAIGYLFIILGLVGGLYGFYNRLRAGRVSGAPFAKSGDAAKGTGAGPKGEISVEGGVHCQQPITSPVTGQACLYYEMKVLKVWKDGQQSHSKELESAKRSTAFTVDDGSGPVAVDASKGGDFDGMKDFSEEKGLGLLGTFTGKTLEFGQYKLEIGAFTPGSNVKYKVIEKVLPVVPKLYVNGKAENGGITSPNWRMLILSPKSRDEILGAATKAAKIFLPAGLGATAVGAVLAVVASLMTPAAAKTADTANVTKSLPAATATATVAATATTAAPATNTTTTADYKVGDHVAVDWKGSTYPATIVAAQGKDSYKIHYDGYAASWDETVGPSRIKGRK
jgi:hypothetical protein